MSYKWQWQSDNGWVDFGESYGDQIEQAYLDDLGTLSLYIGDQSYTVDLGAMEQTNIGVSPQSTHL